MTTFTVDPTTLTSLRNKTILITGGSSGIGLATASLLGTLSPTNRIAILDLQPPPPSLSLPASNLSFHPCDLTSWPAQESAFRAAVAALGPLDAVFVNAGIAEHGEQFFTPAGKDGKLTPPDLRTLTIDLDAAAMTTKLAIHHLRANPRGGSIVLTASLAGYLASAGAPLYSAAKHGIVGLMRALKQEVAAFNIAISLVAPGITVTPILNANRQLESLDSWARDMEKVGVPINRAESVALAVGWLVNEGMGANGMGLLVQSDRMVDLERELAKARGLWMGEEMLALFRGGRNAPLFERVGEKEKAKI
ncbi:NAD(P)-binding protein [Trichodelitschia bisporula]|uniref:NAD(P)-binding protein n=1 Tax=Trichodelitschia bisporula TaxID=703511 RepID=A0A6G1HSX4_9PEZI|nr:NAD(P)-binding protein [Trichodelitschia bisporula]